jgi:putative acetyltransferase
MGIFRKNEKYPSVVNEDMVGKYELNCFSGGGYFYDGVLEYRVWYKEGKKSYCKSFLSYKDASEFYAKQARAEKPIVLVLQNEHINEPEPGVFEHIKKPRVTEWQVAWLKNGKREKDSIDNFLKHNNPG